MKKLIIGNWKMNLGVGDASLYLHKLADMIPAQRTVDVVLAPTILTLQSLSLQVNRRQFKLAAQNCYWRDQGAYHLHYWVYKHPHDVIFYQRYNG